MAITKEQKLKKCKKRKKPSCKKSEFGCCPDGKTAAEGPFSKGNNYNRGCHGLFRWDPVNVDYLFNNFEVINIF